MGKKGAPSFHAHMVLPCLSAHTVYTMSGVGDSIWYTAHAHASCIYLHKQSRAQISSIMRVSMRPWPGAPACPARRHGQAATPRAAWANAQWRGRAQRRGREPTQAWSGAAVCGPRHAAWPGAATVAWPGTAARHVVARGGSCRRPDTCAKPCGRVQNTRLHSEQPDPAGALQRSVHTHC